jgi:hypothetical protein
MNVRVANLVGELVPMGGRAMQEITVSTEAVGIGALHERTTHVWASWDGAEIRMRIDGEDPVGGASGHLLVDKGSDVWSRKFATQVKVIRNASTDAKLRITEMQLC